MSKTGVQPSASDSTDVAVLQHFLETAIDRHWFHVYFMTANDENARPQGFVGADAQATARKIVAENLRGRNIYWAVNPPDKGQRKKALEAEVTWLCGPHVDIDLSSDIRRDSVEAEDALDDLFAKLDALPDIFPGGSLIINTGNGAQVAWFFHAPILATTETVAQLKTLNSALIEAFKRYIRDDRFKIDTCHNVDRIVRMPETINWPTKKKLTRGCFPVFAEVYQWPGDSVAWDDFARLPRVEQVRARRAPDRVDYSVLGYSEITNPYSADDLLAEYPDIAGRVRTTIRDHAGDRSAGVWALLRTTCEFIERMEGIGPAEVLDDTELKTNISRIIWELDDRFPDIEHAMGHIREHFAERAQLGYELDRCLADRIDNGAAGSSPQAAAKAEKAKTIHEASTGPVEHITVDAANLAFLTHVQTSITREALPNAVATDKSAALVQGTTAANIRAIFSAAGITARWDAMRDRVDFQIDPHIGTTGGAPTRPGLMFKIATSAASALERADTAMTLILDSLFTQGLRDRDLAVSHIEQIAGEKPFHPLEDYCRGVRWDGVDRYGQVADCLTSAHPLKREYIAIFFRSIIAAVKSLHSWRRTGQGQEMSASIVLIGPQGIGKSSFLRALVPAGFLAPGTSLSLGKYGDADSKKACLSGAVCILNELGQTHRRSEADSLKDFLSSTQDSYRTAYARRPILKPRMTAFAGTANEDFQLLDSTGDRRWLCMFVSAIDRERAAVLDLEQIYAQAWHEVMDCNVKWWLEPEQDRIRSAENEEWRSDGDDAGYARDYLSHKPVGAQLEWLTATQVARVLNISYKSWSWARVRKVLDDFGIEYRVMLRRKDGSKLQKVYAFPVLPEVYRSIIAQPGRV